jgi:hypothetical protein
LPAAAADHAACPREGGDVLFFQLNTLVVTLILFVVVIGATALGHFIGRRERDKSEGNSEPFGVMQAAMLGFMGLSWRSASASRWGATRTGERRS